MTETCRKCKKQVEYKLPAWKRCVECRREYMRSYQANNREKMRAYRKQYVERNPDRMRGYFLSYRYGVTLDWVRGTLAAQDNKCFLCGVPVEWGRGFARKGHIDHDHTTGAVRAILCANCNNALGHFGDDPSRLRAAADYIERHRSKAATA